MDAAEDVEEDVPLEPRPDLLEGGIVVYEAAVHQIRNFIVIRRGNGGAAFVEPGEAVAPNPVVAGCEVVSVGGESTPLPPGYDAGVIRVTTDTEEFTLTPEEGDNGFSYVSSLDAMYDDVVGSGGMIQVTSAGGRHTRGFDAMIMAPADYLLNDPAPDDSVDRGSDLNLAWSPSGTDFDTVVAVTPLTETFGAVQGSGLSCPAGSDGGSFVIPAAAMAEVTGGARLAVTVIKVKTVEFDAGDDTFVLSVTTVVGNFVQF
jgi:hypothetical protein